ncbi:hypothetical protein ANAPH2_00494 [Anaplasma phagocytophilum]|nr:hypothetical protein ANAPH2_00494 [Anaplasma phagocytophilum]
MKIIICAAIEYSPPYIGYGVFYTVHFYEGHGALIHRWHRFSLVDRKITYYIIRHSTKSPTKLASIAANLVDGKPPQDEHYQVLQELHIQDFQHTAALYILMLLRTVYA